MYTKFTNRVKIILSMTGRCIAVGIVLVFLVSWSVISAGESLVMASITELLDNEMPAAALLNSYDAILQSEDAEVIAQIEAVQNQIIVAWKASGMSSDLESFGSAISTSGFLSLPEMMLAMDYFALSAEEAQTRMDQVNVTTDTTGNGSGSIVLDPSGGAYLPGTNLTVMAVPHAGSQFTGWSSALSGMENPTTLLVDGTKHLVAQFTPLSILNSHTFGDGSVTFNPPGGEYQTGSTVSLTATPSNKWLFQKWIGPVSNPNSKESTIKIRQDDTMVAAVFVNRPGIVELDIVSDFAYLLSKAGELESVATFDRNEFKARSKSEPLYVENGIPDAAELYLLEYILKNPAIDHSRRSGIAHDYAWKVWEQNLDSVTSDLPPGTDPRITRATAGLISLGHFASVKLALDLAAEATGVMINVKEKEDPTNPASPYRYHRNAGSFLSANGDADNDGRTNREEWNAASPDGSLDNLETYALYATNVNFVP